MSTTEDVGYMTVGELKKLIATLADETPVILEVVKSEDEEGETMFADHGEVEEQEGGAPGLFITGFAE